MPHYLLLSQVDRTEGSGRWQFVLQADDGARQFEASDTEPGLQGERLDLLTVVRALESLDQPSQVTLVDCPDYVWKGVRFGLHEWSANGWQWEFFGRMVPVKNSDLWQRMDRALRFHDVECRRRRFDPPHHSLSGVVRSRGQERSTWGLRKKFADWLKYAKRILQGGACANYGFVGERSSTG
jgi:ribonuclease HI